MTAFAHGRDLTCLSVGVGDKAVDQGRFAHTGVPDKGGHVAVDSLADLREVIVHTGLHDGDI